jgi:hypothetical protein
MSHTPPPRAVALEWRNGFLYWRLANGRFVSVRDVDYWREFVGVFEQDAAEFVEPDDDEFAAMLRGDGYEE